ncbi:hypothetical protein Cci01nite_82640 [Catellatospora citrea]|uniref:Secreted protein n=1 Tax=Catellatospora citrea TaxID=53366 RepID=A0A8J3KU12_9ACTN|nr:hypothetical protein Cci01nite_82640 [Catellatospora citrea]
MKGLIKAALASALVLVALGTTPGVAAAAATASNFSTNSFPYPDPGFCHSRVIKLAAGSYEWEYYFSGPKATKTGIMRTILLAAGDYTWEDCTLMTGPRLGDRWMQSALTWHGDREHPAVTSVNWYLGDVSNHSIEQVTWGTKLDPQF